MFTLLLFFLKGTVLSILLWVGCAKFGRLFYSGYSGNIIHHIMMLGIAIITSILIVFYSLFSSFHSNIKEYGEIINIEKLTQKYPFINTWNILSDEADLVTDTIKVDFYEVLLNKLSGLKNKMLLFIIIIQLIQYAIIARAATLCGKRNRLIWSDLE